MSKMPNGDLLESRLPCCLQKQGDKVIISHEGCGSSDAMSLYYHKDHDNAPYQYKCFSCNNGKYFTEQQFEMLNKGSHSVNSLKHKATQVMQTNKTPRSSFTEDLDSDASSVLKTAGIVKPFRGLTKETCERFGVTCEVNANGEVTSNIYPYFNPKNQSHVLGQKVKFLKDVNGNDCKEFTVLSDSKSDWNKAGLFGQQLFAPGSAEKITVTEGELDAMSCYQMQGSKYPCVSIKNGAGSIRKMLENKEIYNYLDSFKEIVLSFDNDDKGMKATEVFSDIFPEKTKVMRMELKDANEYLQQGKAIEFNKLFWKADKYRPDGLALSSEFIDAVVTGTVARGAITYPFKELNRKLFGMRKGELTTWTAGTSVGKSAIIREISKYLWDNIPKDERIGMLMLEESPEKTVTGLVGIHMNKPLLLWDLDKQLPEEMRILKDVIVTDAERRKAAEDLLGSDRFVIMKNSFQSHEVDKIIQKVRQMNKVYGCEYIFLDHLSIIVSGQENGDERKALDEVTTKLRRLVEETGICLHVVSHLRRPQGKGHEEGAEISIADLRGTAGIGQLSDNVIGLERNQQHEDSFLRNVTTMRVLKCRVTGLTGTAGYVYYDIQSGRLNSIDNDEFDARMEAYEDKKKKQKDGNRGKGFEEPINKFDF